MNPNWRVILLGIWLLILWIAESAVPLMKNDRKHVLVNFAFTILTIVINTLLLVVLIKVIDFCSEYYVGLFNYYDMPFAVQMLIGVFVLDLFAAYLSHRTMHMRQLFWRYHQVHHLDEMVDVTTGLRQHPFETVHRFVFLLFGVIILGASLSVVVIYQTISAFNALLEHSNIRVNEKLERMLSLIFITPNFHKVHHSIDVKYANSNYGNIFSVWDRMFGTYRPVIAPASLVYGIEDAKPHNIISLLFAPFRKR